MKQPSSIFNNVIGPIMRGSSSSHVAAAARIGALSRQMVQGNMKEVTVQFDVNGALATTFHGHGSDMGFAGGLLGYMPWDKKLPEALEQAKNEGISIIFEITEYDAEHPNTYRINISSDANEHISLDAISIGGGMIEIQSMNDLGISISGDFFETVILLTNMSDHAIKEAVESVKQKAAEYEFIDYSLKDNHGLINMKTKKKPTANTLKELSKPTFVTNIISLNPILPIASSKDINIPFINAQEMLEFNEGKNLEFWELAALYESQRGNISEEEVYEKMRNIVLIMEEAIEHGLEGTSYEDRILGRQSHLVEIASKSGKLIPGDIINNVIKSITAIMEVKSAMGVIVAAPTAGSAGGLPGTLLGTANTMGFDMDQKIRSMFAAGIIGVFISENSGFAAEVGGCQVECGAGSGMAAAGLVQLLGGTVNQCLDAASMALQNILGMVCDPVGERVEVPCLGKNIMAGTNAIACANMALSGFDKVIPLDETVIAMDKVGRMLPSELRCTGKGGLSMTKTSINQYKRLNAALLK